VIRIQKVVTFLILTFGINLIFFAKNHSAQAETAFGKERQSYTVMRAVDGDTLKLPNGQNLRLAGVNAPELHNMPKLTQEAKRFKKEIWAYRLVGGDAHKVVGRFLTASKNKVQVEADVETLDEEGNFLGYVFIPVAQLEKGAVPDGVVFFQVENHYEVFLNAYLVKMGLAEVSPDGAGRKYHNLFLKLQKEAQENKKGLWV